MSRISRVDWVLQSILTDEFTKADWWVVTYNLIFFWICMVQIYFSKTVTGNVFSAVQSSWTAAAGVFWCESWRRRFLDFKFTSTSYRRCHDFPIMKKFQRKHKPRKSPLAVCSLPPKNTLALPLQIYSLRGLFDTINGTYVLITSARQKMAPMQQTVCSMVNYFLSGRYCLYRCSCNRSVSFLKLTSTRLARKLSTKVAMGGLCKPPRATRV